MSVLQIKKYYTFKLNISDVQVKKVGLVRTVTRKTSFLHCFNQLHRQNRSY